MFEVTDPEASTTSRTDAISLGLQQGPKVDATHPLGSVAPFRDRTVSARPDNLPNEPSPEPDPGWTADKPKRRPAQAGQQPGQPLGRSPKS